jgi:hypothetical protein
MTLWVDEYRPTSFDELTFNTEEALQLQNLWYLYKGKER